jgi:hypothetical protein
MSGSIPSFPPHSFKACTQAILFIKYYKFREIYYAVLELLQGYVLTDSSLDRWPMQMQLYAKMSKTE